MPRDTPINNITVLCDSRRVQRIAITCRCTRRWIELVPAELHDSDMIAEFQCIACGTRYHLHHKTLQRVKEDTLRDSDKQTFAAIRTDNDVKYDA